MKNNMKSNIKSNMKNNMKNKIYGFILLLLLLLIISTNVYAKTFYSIGVSLSIINSGTFSGYGELGFGGSALLFDLGFGTMYVEGYSLSATKFGIGYRYYFDIFSGFYLGINIGTITLRYGYDSLSIGYSTLSAGYRYIFNDTYKNYEGFFIEGALIIYSVSDLGSGIGLYIGLGYAL